MRVSQFRYSVIISVIGIFIFSCSEEGNKTEARIDSLLSLPIPLDTMNETFMKKDSVFKDTLSKTITPAFPEIEGQVFYKLPYCGGARPTEEILAEHAIEKPLPNSTLKLKNNSEIFSLTTDKNGIFRISIPPGKYEVFLTKETNKKIYDVSPAACENCLTQAITRVEILSGKKNAIKFTFRCDPQAKMRP